MIGVLVLVGGLLFCGWLLMHLADPKDPSDR